MPLDAVALAALPLGTTNAQAFASNAGNIDRLVNGTGAIATRNGKSLLTLDEALRRIGYETPVAFASGLSILRGSQTVINGGLTYHANPASLPFTTTGTFNSAQWLLVSNVTTQDLASTSTGKGLSMLGLQDSADYFPPSVTTGEQALAHLGALAKRNANLRDFGAKADNGTTDCSTALGLAIAAGYQVLEFPVLAGEHGTAYFSTFDANSALVGKTLDFDIRLTISVPDNGIVGYVNSVGIRHKQPTTYYLRNLSAKYLVSPDGGELWYLGGQDKRTPQLMPAQALRDKTTAINTGAMTARKIPWPNSDTWASDSYSSSTSAIAYFQPAADASFHFACTAAVAGDEFSASLGANGSPLLACVVRHAGGFCGVMSNADYTSQPSYFNKSTGSSGTSNSISLNGISATHETYTALGSVWTVRIISIREFAILWNGYEVVRQTTSGDISEVGFGGYPSASGQTIGINDTVNVTGSEYRPGSLVSVALFGDSKVALRGDAWHVYMRDALDHALGGSLRCWKVDNHAVAGQAVSQQRAVMAGVSMSQYNVACISIGTNDVQGLTSISAFDVDLRAMLTQCASANCKVVLGMPSLWYTQSQAGARGQASSNYGRAAPYRQRVRRIAADFGSSVRCIDEAQLHGPALAHYVNSSLSPSLVGAGDPVYYDNIHHTTRANERTGYEYARAIAGFYC